MLEILNRKETNKEKKFKRRSYFFEILSDKCVTFEPFEIFMFVDVSESKGGAISEPKVLTEGAQKFVHI